MQRPDERLHQLVDDLRELGLDPDHHTGLLAPLLGLDPSVGYARAGDRPHPRCTTRSSARCRAWLGARSGARSPMVLLVEDVHWADPSTCELLVGSRARPDRGRPARWPPSARGAERLFGRELVVIELEPLTADESAELGPDDRRRRSTAPASQTTLRRGQGNPLFLEELLAVDTRHRSTPSCCRA